VQRREEAERAFRRGFATEGAHVSPIHTYHSLNIVHSIQQQPLHAVTSLELEYYLHPPPIQSIHRQHGGVYVSGTSSTHLVPSNNSGRVTIPRHLRTTPFYLLSHLPTRTSQLQHHYTRFQRIYSQPHRLVRVHLYSRLPRV
jgi:hypothetical protein